MIGLNKIVMSHPEDVNYNESDQMFRLYKLKIWGVNAWVMSDNQTTKQLFEERSSLKDTGTKEQCDNVQEKIRENSL